MTDYLSAYKDNSLMNLGYKSILDKSPLPIIIFDIRFNIVYSNNKFNKYLYFTSNEIKHISVLKLLDQNTQNEISNFIENNGQEFRGFCQLKDKFDQAVLSELIISKSDQNNLFTAYFYIKNTKKEKDIPFDEKVEYFDTLAHESNESIIITINNENKAVYITDSVTKILGYAPDDIINMDVLDFCYPDDVQRLLRKRELSIQKAIQHYSQTFRFRHKNGKYIWLEAKINRNFSPEGIPIKTIAIVRDISKRIEYEDALIKAKQMAEEAVTSKNKFLSEISHDIRTPMNAIIGVSHLLLNKNPRKDQIDLINTIKFSGENLLALINDILDFSKIQINKIEFESVDFNLSLLLKSLKIGFKTPAESKGVRFDVITKGKIPEVVKGDSVRLNQILNNLLSNAIKFTPKGKVILEVQADEKEDRYDMLFKVSDTGIGISRDKINKIFEPFTQADKETYRKYGGSGLGLSILKKLVELQGGKVDVQSIPGEGSVFEVSLSFEKPDIENSVAYFEDNELKRIRVLYVEDVVSNQLLMKGFFAMWKINLDIASSGSKAIEMIKEQSYDLILSDLQLPDISGFDIVERVRNMDNNYFKNLPFIAVTGTVKSKIQGKAKNAGFSDFITKPINPDKLFKKISGYIDTSLRKDTVNNSKSVANFDSLDSLYVNKQEEYHNLLSLIKMEYEKYKEALVYSIENKDLKGIRGIVHKMNPNLKTLQMNDFIDALEEVKTSIRLNPDQAGTEKLTQKILIFFDRLLLTIDEKLHDLAS